MRGAVPLPERERTRRFRDAVAKHAPERTARAAEPIWPDYVRLHGDTEVAAAQRQEQARAGRKGRTR